MFLTIEGVEHRFIKINPLLISYSIHMVTFGTSHYQVCHCSNLHRICMMLSSMLHTKCVKWRVHPVRIGFGSGPIVQQEWYQPTAQDSSALINLRNFKHCCHRFMYSSSNSPCLCLVGTMCCCSFLLLFLWHDCRYNPTPCLHLVPNHLQNATTNTDLVVVDNLVDNLVA